MTRSAQTTRFRRFRRALATVALAALLMAPSAMAAGEFEPNDTPETAYGPLAAGVTYAATLESDEDSDNYFFYVAGDDPAPVRITIADTTPLGGGLFAGLLDADLDTIDELDVTGEESDVFEETLEPGVYYLALETAYLDQFNETYEIHAEGGGGAFASGAEIRAQCSLATATVSKAKAALRRARQRLRRALSHHSRHGVVRARRAIRKARARLRKASAEAALRCMTAG